MKKSSQEQTQGIERTEQESGSAAEVQFNPPSSTVPSNFVYTAPFSFAPIQAKMQPFPMQMQSGDVIQLAINDDFNIKTMSEDDGRAKVVEVTNINGTSYGPGHNNPTGADDPKGWQDLKDARHTKGSAKPNEGFNAVRMHLWNGRLRGPGNDHKNLAPGPAKINSQMSVGAETDMKNLVDQGLHLDLKTELTYSSTADYPEFAYIVPKRWLVTWSTTTDGTEDRGNHGRWDSGPVEPPGGAEPTEADRQDLIKLATYDSENIDSEINTGTLKEEQEKSKGEARTYIEGQAKNDFTFLDAKTRLERKEGMNEQPHLSIMKMKIRTIPSAAVKHRFLFDYEAGLAWKLFSSLDDADQVAVWDWMVALGDFKRATLLHLGIPHNGNSYAREVLATAAEVDETSYNSLLGHHPFDEKNIARLYFSVESVASSNNCHKLSSAIFTRVVKTLPANPPTVISLLTWAKDHGSLSYTAVQKIFIANAAKNLFPNRYNPYQQQNRQAWQRVGQLGLIGYFIKHDMGGKEDWMAEAGDRETMILNSPADTGDTHTVDTMADVAGSTPVNIMSWIESGDPFTYIGTKGGINAAAVALGTSSKNVLTYIFDYDRSVAHHFAAIAELGGGAAAAIVMGTTAEQMIRDRTFTASNDTRGDYLRRLGLARRDGDNFGLTATKSIDAVFAGEMNVNNMSLASRRAGNADDIAVLYGLTTSEYLQKLWPHILMKSIAKVVKKAYCGDLELNDELCINGVRDYMGAAQDQVTDWWMNHAKKQL